MALINQPPQTAVDSGNQVSQGWVTFFGQVFRIISALTLSGTTANRPTKFLWAGRPYFDTTLGYSIWYNGTIWVTATGAPA